MKAQLAESAPMAALMKFVDDDDWWIEQKLDGHRILVHYDHGDVDVLNRNGMMYRKSFPGFIVQAVTIIAQHFDHVDEFILDGELIGEKYWMFDLPRWGNVVNHDTGYAHRRRLLQQFHDVGITTLGDIDERRFRRHLGVIPTAKDQEKKAELAKRVLEVGGEGLMVKDPRGVYRSGARSREMLKVKFHNEAEVIVLETNRLGKESLSLGIVRDGQVVEVGACSTIGKEPVEVGDVITVRYLYLGADERLVQPRMMRKRDDKTPGECLWSQLKPVNKEVLI